MSKPSSWLASTPIISRASAGTSSPVAKRCSSAATCLGPLATVTPNSAAWPRMALISIVRCLTSKSRTPSIVSAACCPALLTGTNRVLGRPICLADRLRIDRVVLATPHVSLDVLRRDQQHLVPQPPQHPCPVVRGAASLHADSRRRQLGKHFLHLAAPDPLPQDRLIVLVNPMHLKDVFGRIQTNSDNRHSDGSLGCVVTTSQPGTFDAVGGPSTPTSTRCWCGRRVGPGLRRGSV